MRQDSAAPEVLPDDLLAARRAIALARGPDKLRQIEVEALRLAPLVERGALVKQDTIDALIDFARGHGLCLSSRALEEVEHVVREGINGRAAGVGYAPPPKGTPLDRANGRRHSPIVTKAADAAPEWLATPWWRDPVTIPARQFLDRDKHYCRGKIGATVGGGGRGKTTRACYEAIEKAVGHDLVTRESLPHGALRVLLLNGEEDQDEIDRRLAAVCQHYNLSQSDLGGRLIAKSVLDVPMRIAAVTRESGPTRNEAVTKTLKDMIMHNRIDVFMIDPLVSFHSGPENDNGFMDLVIKEGFGRIASATNSAGELFHHPGKPKPGQAETTVEDSRGASSVIWAVRSARVFNFMSSEDAQRVGIGEDDRRHYVRISNGKANNGPVGKAKWMRLLIENLPNGDEVAVASPWAPPNPFDGLTTTDMELAVRLAGSNDYRADSRSPKWFGYALADRLNIAVTYGADNDPKDIARLSTIIKTWLKNKVLAIEERKDRQSKERKFIVPGSKCPRATSDAETADDEALL